MFFIILLDTFKQVSLYWLILLVAMLTEVIGILKDANDFVISEKAVTFMVSSEEDA